MIVSNSSSESEQAKPKLLLVDDDETLLRLMSIRLQSEGFDVTSVDNGSKALRLTYNNHFDVVLSDLRMPGMDGLNLFDEVLQKNPDMPLILMTAHGSIKEAVAATQRGVFSFLTKPVDHKELKRILLRAISQTTRESVGDWCQDIITRSPDMIRVLKQAEQLAKKDVSVLINGANGTGKELLAKAIHNASERNAQPFISINCGALPDQLLEQELFGVVAPDNAAQQSLQGLFKEANGGTLFLDEVNDLPMSVQAKLFNVLREKKVRPVGSNQSFDFDIRLISASDKNLQEALLMNEFREDLFYQLNIVDLTLPTLKERFEDIPLLADYFLKKSAEQYKIKVQKFADDAITTMTKFEWPGNVRQLNNVVERCVALTNHSVISSSLVEQALSQENQYWPSLTEARDSFEYEYLCKLMNLTQGNVTKASDLAGRNRTDLHKLMKKHGLVAADFRPKT